MFSFEYLLCDESLDVPGTSSLLAKYPGGDLPDAVDGTIIPAQIWSKQGISCLEIDIWLQTRIVLKIRLA
jgi:hypothetical protein